MQVWTSDWTRGKKDSAVEVLHEVLQDRSFGLNSELISEICSSSSSIAEKCVLLEYAQLSRILPPDGMYIIPVRECLLRWDGIFFVHNGPFEGSIVRFLIKIPENYPLEKPEIICNQAVPFHPLFDDLTGRVDTNPVFPSWTSTGWINDVLRYFEQILYLDRLSMDWITDYCRKGVSTNEAGQLLLKSQHLYFNKAKQFVDQSIKYLYDDPDSSIKFKQN